MSVQQKTRHEPEASDIYKSNRGEFYQILYLDDQIVLLRSDEAGRGGDNTHRIERRVHFNDEIESGFFSYQPDSNLDMMSDPEQDWAEVSYIGKKTSFNLWQAGYKTSLDVQQADDDELLDVDGLGKAGLQNLREFVR